MLSSLRTRTSNAVRVLGRVRRYGTPIEAIPKADQTPGAPGALRPHLNIPVNPNHGLYAFFRKREKDGKVTHDPLEDDAGLRDTFGESPAPSRSFPSYGQPFLTVVGSAGSFQVGLGAQQSSGEKASGISTPCGTFS